MKQLLVLFLFLVQGINYCYSQDELSAKDQSALRKIITQMGFKYIDEYILFDFMVDLDKDSFINKQIKCLSVEDLSKSPKSDDFKGTQEDYHYYYNELARFCYMDLVMDINRSEELSKLEKFYFYNTYSIRGCNIGEKKLCEIIENFQNKLK